MHLSGEILEEYLVKRIVKEIPGVLALHTSTVCKAEGCWRLVDAGDIPRYEIRVLTAEDGKIKGFRADVYPCDEKPQFGTVQSIVEMALSEFPGLEDLRVKDEYIRDLLNHRETREWAKVEQTEEGHSKNRDAY